jgi:putative phosphoesterase
VTSRIGVVGDTHIPAAGPDLPSRVYEVLAGCDQILHCGDLHTISVVDRLERLAPTLASRGNGDNPRTHPPGVGPDPRVADRFVIDVDDLRVGLIHDLENAEFQSEEEVSALLLRRFDQPVDIAISGHTHVPMVWGLSDGTALFNPGSPTLPYGYRDIPGTLGVLDVDGRSFEFRVIDLADETTQLSLLGPAPHPLTKGPRPTGGR